MAACWPIIIPPVLVGVAITFALQSRTSSKRIALVSAPDSDRLSRLGLALRERRNSIVEQAAEVLSPGAPSDRDVDGKPAPEDAMFTPAQKRMAKHLHGLAARREERGKSPMQLNIVYSPEARHSHATIVGRTISQFPLHAIGRAVLRHWLVEFEL